MAATKNSFVEKSVSTDVPLPTVPVLSRPKYWYIFGGSSFKSFQRNRNLQFENLSRILVSTWSLEHIGVDCQILASHFVRLGS